MTGPDEASARRAMRPRYVPFAPVLAVILAGCTASVPPASEPPTAKPTGEVPSNGAPLGALPRTLQLATNPVSKDGAPGSTQVYAVTVANMADEADPVSFQARSSAGWTVRLSAHEATIEPRNSTMVLVAVSVPRAATDGARDVTILTASSGLGAAPQALGLTTTVRWSGGACNDGAQADTDCDGVHDVEERWYGSDPRDPRSTPAALDSDSDGSSNQAEVEAGCDPFDATDTPLASGGCSAPARPPTTGRLVSASIAAKAIDLPWANADTDTSDDAIEIVLASAASDLANADVTLRVDGILLTWDAANANFAQGGALAADQWCTTSPGGDTNAHWERGASVILVKSDRNPTTVCDGTLAAMALDLVNQKGLHTLKVTVQDQVVFDATLEVHDDAEAN